MKKPMKRKGMKPVAKRKPASPAARVPDGAEYSEKGFGAGKLSDKGKKR